MDFLNNIDLIVRGMSYISRNCIYEWSAVDSNVLKLQSSLLTRPELVNTPNEVPILNLRTNFLQS